MVETLIDPNGQSHQVGDLYCSGCDYNPENPRCSCGGLNHYWFIDNVKRSTLLGFECEACGGFNELTPITNDESA